jgi:hypothetical protein
MFHIQPETTPFHPHCATVLGHSPLTLALFALALGNNFSKETPVGILSVVLWRHFPRQEKPVVADLPFPQRDFQWVLRTMLSRKCHEKFVLLIQTISKMQIAFKDKVRADEKAQYT